MEQGKARGDARAERQPADVSAAEPEVVEDVPEVERPAAERVARGVGRAVRPGVAPRLPEDHAPPGGEARRVGRPHVGVAADAVGEDERRCLPRARARPARRSGTVLLVVDPDPVGGPRVGQSNLPSDSGGRYFLPPPPPVTASSTVAAAMTATYSKPAQVRPIAASTIVPLRITF